MPYLVLLITSLIKQHFSTKLFTKNESQRPYENTTKDVGTKYLAAQKWFIKNKTEIGGGGLLAVCHLAITEGLITLNKAVPSSNSNL